MPMLKKVLPSMISLPANKTIGAMAKEMLASMTTGGSAGKGSGSGKTTPTKKKPTATEKAAAVKAAAAKRKKMDKIMKGLAKVGLSILRIISKEVTPIVKNEAFKPGEVNEFIEAFGLDEKTSKMVKPLIGLLAKVAKLYSI